MQSVVSANDKPQKKSFMINKPPLVLRKRSLSKESVNSISSLNIPTTLIMTLLINFDVDASVASPILYLEEPSNCDLNFTLKLEIPIKNGDYTLVFDYDSIEIHLKGSSVDLKPIYMGNLLKSQAIRSIRNNINSSDPMLLEVLVDNTKYYITEDDLSKTKFWIKSKQGTIQAAKFVKIAPSIVKTRLEKDTGEKIQEEKKEISTIMDLDNHVNNIKNVNYDQNIEKPVKYEHVKSNYDSSSISKKSNSDDMIPMALVYEATGDMIPKRFVIPNYNGMYFVIRVHPIGILPGDQSYAPYITFQNSIEQDLSTVYNLLPKNVLYNLKDNEFNKDGVLIAFKANDTLIASPVINGWLVQNTGIFSGPKAVDINAMTYGSIRFVKTGEKDIVVSKWLVIDSHEVQKYTSTYKDYVKLLLTDIVAQSTDVDPSISNFITNLLSVSDDIFNGPSKMFNGIIDSKIAEVSNKFVRINKQLFDHQITVGDRKGNEVSLKVRLDYIESVLDDVLKKIKQIEFNPKNPSFDINKINGKISDMNNQIQQLQQKEGKSAFVTALNIGTTMRQMLIGPNWVGTDYDGEFKSNYRHWEVLSTQIVQREKVNTFLNVGKVKFTADYNLRSTYEAKLPQVIHVLKLRRNMNTTEISQNVSAASISMYSQGYDLISTTTTSYGEYIIYKLSDRIAPNMYTDFEVDNVIFAGAPLYLEQIVLVP